MAAISLLMIKLVAERGPAILAICLLVILPLLWIIFAGSRWWLLMPVAIAFGGTFSAAHKFSTYEVSLPLCLLALLPLIATGKATKINRPALPKAAGFLLLLIVVDWIVSLYISEWRGLAGSGGISRVYFNALWAVVFLITFYRYGITRHLKTILIAVYLASLARVCINILSFFLGEYIYIPGINYVLGGMSPGLTDLRFSALQLVIIAFACLQFSSRTWVKIFHIGMISLSVGLVFLGGGRVSVGMLCAIPLMWALLKRRFGWMAVIGGSLLLIMVIINHRPDFIHNLPENARRAASILIRESSTRWVDQHEIVRGSNEWHRRLIELGFKRWIATPLTFVSGHHVEPYDKEYDALSATTEFRAQVAAKLGSYESGLWVVLGVLGIAGLLLYIRIFLFLLKEPFRELQTHGVVDIPHVFCLWALLEAGLWCVFAWIAGTFPSHELMMAVIAKAALEDHKRKTPEPAQAQTY
jgi:hypothetical protein